MVWRCHIGHERHDAEVDRGWAFLRPYLEPATPRGVLAQRVRAGVDRRAPNGRARAEHRSVLGEEPGALRRSGPRHPRRTSGWSTGRRHRDASVFTRDDGSVGRVDREAEVVRLGAAAELRDAARRAGLALGRDEGPDRRARRASRARSSRRARAARSSCSRARASTASPTIPRAPRSSPRSSARGARCRDALRRTVHLALLPMQDAEENAAIVNALQRHAAVIVQKSLHEGFGLTVTEAMWKRRPGGRERGRRHRRPDPRRRRRPAGPRPDGPRRVRGALRRVLGDPALAQRLGDAGYATVRDHYLTDLRARALGRAGRPAGQLTRAPARTQPSWRLSAAASSRWYRRSRGPLGACRSIRRKKGSTSGVGSPCRSASAKTFSWPLRVSV